MELVGERLDIIRNAVHFNSYRDSKEDDLFYRERLRLGNIFIYFNIDNIDIFCPSRFVGYKDNNRKKHEEFSQKYGTHSTYKIDSILGKHDLIKGLETIYQNLCNDIGIKPSDNKRQYWEMYLTEDEILQAVLVHDENYPDELCQSHIYTEGASKQVSVNVYERNEEARKKCIEHFGCKCIVCGLAFDKKYGEIGVDFIHVHHLKPISMIKKNTN